MLGWFISKLVAHVYSTSDSDTKKFRVKELYFWCTLLAINLCVCPILAEVLSFILFTGCLVIITFIVKQNLLKSLARQASQLIYYNYWIHYIPVLLRLSDYLAGKVSTRRAGTARREQVLAPWILVLPCLRPSTIGGSISFIHWCH